MRTSKVLAVGMLAALVLGLAAAEAGAQYYVPLRYDMRYTSNPGYIGPITTAPPLAPDPYSYGAIQYGNLALTGNVRFGKSFQAFVPYNQQGSQLSTFLPSMALSNFKRDSVSLEDVAAGMTYGAGYQPYFPGPGSVTSLYTAETRFAQSVPGLRAPYTLPNLNTALPIVPPTTTPGVYYVPPSVTTAGPTTATPSGLVIPQYALDWVRSLSEGGVVTTTTGAAATSTTGQPTLVPRLTDPRIGLQPTSSNLKDLRLGLPPEEAKETEKGTEPPMFGMTVPEGVGTQSLFGGTSAAKSAANAASSESAAFWAVREAAMKEPPRPNALPARTTTSAAAPKRVIPTDEIAALPKGIPPMPEKYSPPGSYADYVKKANEAMQEGNYAKAEDVYAAASAQDPKKSEAFYGRIYALLADRQYDMAYLLLDRDLRTNPGWVKQVPDIAKAISKPGLLDRLTNDLKDSLDVRPGNPDLSFLLGFIYYAGGNNDEALFYLRHLAQVRGKEAGPEKAIMEAIEATSAPKTPPSPAPLK